MAYQYQPPFGALPGDSFERQTTAFLEDAARRAEWGNVEGRPDMEGWQAAIVAQVGDLGDRTTAVEQAVTTAQTGVDANTAAVAALRDADIRQQAALASVELRASVLERDTVSLAERNTALDERIRANRDSLSVLGSRADNTDRAVDVLEERAATAETALHALGGRTTAVEQEAANALATANAHAARHAVGGADRLTPADIGAAAHTITITAGTGLSGGGDLTANRTLAVKYGTAAATACQGNDARLSNARPPTAHKATHKTGGADALSAADVGAAPASAVPVGLIALWDGDTPPPGWEVYTSLDGYVTAPIHYIRYKG